MMRFSITLVVLLTLATPLGLRAEQEDYPRGRLLVEPQQLESGQLDAVIILDARSQEAYAAAHIPGAQWVNHDAWAKAFGDGSEAADWSERIGSLGITKDRPVVIYDDQAMKNAARIWWILRYWGAEDVRLLQGGWKQWQAEQRKTNGEVPAVEPVEFSATSQRERLANKADVLGFLQNSGVQLIDTRSADEFCGLAKLSNTRGGAIPGAKHLEWSQLVDQQTHRFKTAAQLRQLFDEAGIDLRQPTASHCQSGGRASVMVFGLELMGAQDAKNYYRGWSEWGNSEDTPVDVRESADAEPEPEPAPATKP